MTDPAIPRSSAERFGHPAGLWVLAGTELWERISFHGMQALLTLYMVGALLLPGHVEQVVGMTGYRALVESVTGPLSVQALAAQTFGLYIGLIYFAPVLGGLIGDRLTGRRIAVTLGALLMTAGHFALAFDASFLIALLLLIAGAGLLRGNLQTQVKSLYADGDRRETDAFQLYYVAINFGAFIAPIVTGVLAVAYSWHAGFAFAGFGMLVGLVVYLAGQRHLPADDPRTAKAAVKRPLTPGERRRLIGIAMLWPIQILFWVAQVQVWNVYNLWVRDHVTLGIGSFQMPVPWLQAFDGLAPILFLPPVLALWRRQAMRGSEPDQVAKLAIGCAIFCAGVVWLAAAGMVSGPDGRAPLVWAIGFHLISNIGWIYFTPVAVALYAAKSPEQLRGTMLGVNASTIFFAGLISGRIGGLYESVSPAAFWLIHAAIIGSAPLILWLLGGVLRRSLADDAPAPPAAS